MSSSKIHCCVKTHFLLYMSPRYHLISPVYHPFLLLDSLGPLFPSRGPWTPPSLRSLDSLSTCLTISSLSHITGLWDPSSPTRNQTCPVCSGSSESHLLDLQGSPLQTFLSSRMWEQHPDSQVGNLWMKGKPGERRRVWDLRDLWEILEITLAFLTADSSLAPLKRFSNSSLFLDCSP